VVLLLRLINDDLNFLNFDWCSLSQQVLSAPRIAIPMGFYVIILLNSQFSLLVVLIVMLEAC